MNDCSNGNGTLSRVIPVLVQTTAAGVRFLPGRLWDVGYEWEHEAVVSGYATRSCWVGPQVNIGWQLPLLELYSAVFRCWTRDTICQFPNPFGVGPLLNIH